MAKLVRELTQLENILERSGSLARSEMLTSIPSAAGSLPIYGTVLGTSDRSAPTFGLVGGVHGLERIGTRVVLAYLHTVIEMLQWDELLSRSLERIRLVFVPIVNPYGILMRRRGNAAGVDLMRNAPPHPDSQGSFFVGGQRLSPHLPWYMGVEGAPMQPEAFALCNFMRREVFGARRAVVVDVHSGYGMDDRVWFPYARTRKPFPDVGSVYALKQLLDTALPNHVYRVEPQARNYTVCGDLWDFLYDEQRAQPGAGVFLPLTLEMGSWRWVKKNPRQLFDRLGGFNPLKPHRLRRTLRRHLTLFDFLRRATASDRAWHGEGDEERRNAAFRLWFAD